MTLTAVRRIPPSSFIAIHLPTPLLASSKRPSEEPSAGNNPFSPISFYILTSLPFLEEDEEDDEVVETRAAKRRHVIRSSRDKDHLSPDVPEGSKDNRRRRDSRLKPQPSDVLPVKAPIKPHSSSGKKYSAKASKDAV